MPVRRRCNRHIRVSEATLNKVKLTAKILGLSTPNDAVNLLCDRIIREHEEAKKSEKIPEKNEELP